MNNKLATTIAAPFMLIHFVIAMLAVALVAASWLLDKIIDGILGEEEDCNEPTN